MRKFVLGFVTAFVLVLLAVSLWVRLGMVDPRADIAENPLEKAIAMPALDASVDRRAPQVSNPFPPTDDNLVAGMNTYQRDCADCHGDIAHPHDGLVLDPRPPLFMEDAPDMPENQNYYIIQHGIRLTGMPAWKQSLDDRQIWQVAAFLSHIDKLPPEVADQWKVLAQAATGAASSSHPPPIEGGMHKR